MMTRGLKTFGLAAASLLAMTGLALADYGIGEPGQIGLQAAASPIAAEIHWFHDLLVWLITAITVFVLALLVIVMVRFNSKSNPVPSKTTHNAAIEVAWTLIPVLILVIIAVPSFRLLKNQLTIPPADITIKAVGNQWFWGYEYAKDTGNIRFDSYMLTDADRKDPATQPRLLAVDNEVVLPINKTVRVQVTANDVLHSFVIPSLGVRMDAVPGRLNETWFKATREGIYYGQCSELCGKDHAFMPIAFRIVSDAKYAEWLAGAQKKFAAVSDDSRVAVNQSPAAKTAETK
ncbi:MAG: cytochrome c oxidase subunit II [Beijerinckiaceae bacterium]|nr:cytochrome c oxidase subunit II [Beijerinckiaceae bacterium]